MRKKGFYTVIAAQLLACTVFGGLVKEYDFVSTAPNMVTDANWAYFYDTVGYDTFAAALNADLSGYPVHHDGDSLNIGYQGAVHTVAVMMDGSQFTVGQQVDITVNYNAAVDDAARLISIVKEVEVSGTDPRFDVDLWGNINYTVDTQDVISQEQVYYNPGKDHGSGAKSDVLSFTSSGQDVVLMFSAAGAGSGLFELSSISVSQAIPEPATVMLVLGVGGSILFLRRLCM